MSVSNRSTAGLFLYLVDLKRYLWVLTFLKQIPVAKSLRSSTESSSSLDSLIALCLSLLLYTKDKVDMTFALLETLGMVLFVVVPLFVEVQSFVEVRCDVLLSRSHVV
jgi:hypothetical protein